MFQEGPSVPLRTSSCESSQRGWPGNRDGFCLVFTWEISSRLPWWKNVQWPTKTPVRSPRSPKSLRMSVSAKFKSVISKQTWRHLQLYCLYPWRCCYSWMAFFCCGKRLKLAIQFSLLRKQTYRFRSWKRRKQMRLNRNSVGHAQLSMFSLGIRAGVFIRKGFLARLPRSRSGKPRHRILIWHKRCPVSIIL